MFFVLVNAFYGGALTMFFSSAPELPFSSARDGLLLYPKWKMVLPEDQRVLVDSLAKEVKDPPFVEFYRRSKTPNQVKNTVIINGASLQLNCATLVVVLILLSLYCT